MTDDEMREQDVAWLRCEAADRRAYGNEQKSRRLLVGEDRRLYQQHVDHQFAYADRLERIANDLASLRSAAALDAVRAVGGERVESELRAARRLLFLTHPCDGKYGDDGELQCGQCMIDFKRDPIGVIDAKIVAKNLARHQ